ncbi:hydroxyproline O-galactosyltransferase GALT2-like [Impatiens glandulifera]|uniref:hydroxyproline O-galactosyltransferase GALT2-like n=1 Tax=Impatiens glandulifera TaxID=253017 RepID=UPI001FB08A39|nr:hydroxyproline O-galactosyltransferase GALT2-like [Impatiens glandulifera]
MKRPKSEPYGLRRLKLPYILLGIAAFYLIFISFKFPHFLEIATMLSGDDANSGPEEGTSSDNSKDDDLNKPYLSVYKDLIDGGLESNDLQNSPLVPQEKPIEESRTETQLINPIEFSYGSIINRTSDLSVLDKMADEAWILGLKAWEEVDTIHENDISETAVLEGKPESCPSWVSMTSEQMQRGEHIMFLPCGLCAGSSITVVGTPHNAHHENVPQLKITRGNSLVLISQFIVELQGLKAVVGEDPPKILHLNPRLRGDWSNQPVIEHNTCYRMQWGTAQRCDGLPSNTEDDMLVDGHARCEKWMVNDIADSRESKTTSWFKRFIGRAQKPEVTWPFPFAEARLFVLTIRAGVDGFHINVGGRHVSSFPYRTGFTLEDATGLAIKGDMNIHSVHATSLPTSHPSFSPQRVLELSEQWKADPLPKSPIILFVGILSATNHFAERMTVRKTWMQSPVVKSSNVVVRFFVALNPRKEVNAVLKKEAAYFGDIVILPFMDRYELVVLKTIAICEYGIQNVTASYIMKCDDDTFVRVDTVLKEIDGVSPDRPLYMGNLNLQHRPLRSGKWAVTYEEWPEEVYPPYANGPGYIISSDIAKFIITQHANRQLRLFKMEDVSMGTWVEQFNSTTLVQYSHNWKFCQYGCMEDYYTAHYQSPKQMICLWDNLSKGQARCCNFRR